MKKSAYISLGLILIFLLLIIRKLFAAHLTIEDITLDLPRNGSYNSRSLSQIDEIIIHHSAWEGGDPYDYAQLHVAKGWPGIGYHYVIQPSGKIYQTNALSSISYHVSGHNARTIGICLSGDLSKHEMSGAQERALIALVKSLLSKFLSIENVGIHRDYSTTTCPGSSTKLEAILGNRLQKF